MCAESRPSSLSSYLQTQLRTSAPASPFHRRPFIVLVATLLELVVSLLALGVKVR